jgi:hypothetical protein
MKVFMSRNYKGSIFGTFGISQNFFEEGISTGYLIFSLGLVRLEIMWNK